MYVGELTVFSSVGLVGGGGTELIVCTWYVCSCDSCGSSLCTSFVSFFFLTFPHNVLSFYVCLLYLYSYLCM